MKTSIIKYLPMAAALSLVACSNDEENIFNNVAQNDEVSSSRETVTIPVKFKVDSENKSLKKLGYAADANDRNVAVISFTQQDITNGAKLSISERPGFNDPHIMNYKNGEYTDQPYSQFSNPTYTQYLDLVYEEGDFYFAGNIVLFKDKVASFNNGNCKLEGVLYPDGSYPSAQWSYVYSIVSLADLMSKCNHEYTTEFQSNAASFNFVDSHAYLHIQTNETTFQYSYSVPVYPTSSEILNYLSSDRIYDIAIDPNNEGNNDLWIAIPVDKNSSSYRNFFCTWFSGNGVKDVECMDIGRTEPFDIYAGHLYEFERWVK